MIEIMDSSLGKQDLPEAGMYHRVNGLPPPTCGHLPNGIQVNGYSPSRWVRQRTVKRAVRAAGFAFYSRQYATLTLRPAPVNTGIVFRRVDLSPVVEICARIEAISEGSGHAILAQNGVQIAAVEHLMSAFSGLGIDNAIVDITASELPILDGSAWPFSFLIQSAGLIEQDAPKRFICIQQSITVTEGNRWAQVSPYPGFRIHFESNCPHAVCHPRGQILSLALSSTTYIKEISRARTFEMMTNAQQRESGSINGLLLDTPWSEDNLRYKDEWVRHKALSAIGDLYLLGHSLIGMFSGHQSNHDLNNRLLRAVQSAPERWEYVEFKDKQKPYVYPSQLAIV